MFVWWDKGGLDWTGLLVRSSPAFVYRKCVRTNSPTGLISPHTGDNSVPASTVGLLVRLIGLNQHPSLSPSPSLSRPSPSLSLSRTPYPRRRRPTHDVNDDDNDLWTICSISIRFFVTVRAICVHP